MIRKVLDYFLVLSNPFIRICTIADFRPRYKADYFLKYSFPSQNSLASKLKFIKDMHFNMINPVS
jgi:hypothetical protein